MRGSRQRPAPQTPFPPWFGVLTAALFVAMEATNVWRDEAHPPQALLFVVAAAVLIVFVTVWGYGFVRLRRYRREVQPLDAAGRRRVRLIVLVALGIGVVLVAAPLLFL